MGFTIVGVIAVISINAYICNFAKKYILSVDEIKEKDAEYIVILGAKVHANGRLSLMLEDRVKAGVLLYNEDAAPYVVMSGDSDDTSYDEVNPMKQKANELGVPVDNILTDSQGLSTFDSMIRMRDEFKAKKVVIVTQEYHLYRAVYVARKLGLEAYGYPAEKIEYYGQTQRDIREVLARVKDFFYVKIKD